MITPSVSFRIGSSFGWQVGNWLQPLPAAQVWVDHAALDGAGPYDGHLDDNVLEAAGFEPGEHLRLRAALNLKAADGVARRDGAVDRGVVQA
jgi:hypothetical protein